MRHSLLLTTGLALLLVGPLTHHGAAADTASPLTITCPDNMTIVNETYQCGAVVNFAPVVTGAVPIYFVTCSPDSGTMFPLGTTPVNCTVTDGAGRTASCSFNVIVRNVEPPSCILCFFNLNTQACTPMLLVVADSSAGAVLPNWAEYMFQIPDNCGDEQGAVTRSDGQGLGDVYPVGTTVLTHLVTDAAGNSSQCTATFTVLSQFVRLASQVYVQYEVPAPGGPIELAGPAELRLDVNYPTQPVVPGNPVRLHVLIDLHDVVATWNGVQYHVANNVDAQLTANQLSPITLSVPGRYQFEAQGKAALHSFTLDMPLGAVITAGALSSASFRQPQLAQP